MRLRHYGDEKGGGIIITTAPDSHVEQYSQFVLEELKLELKRLPIKADKASGFRIVKNKTEWILPPARETSQVLIPAPGAYPCDICEFARYNQLCQHQRVCTAFTYWSLGTAEKMDGGLKKAFFSQFGKKKS